MMLSKVMLEKRNFLLLDEPTNHLDITSKEILQQAAPEIREAGIQLMSLGARLINNATCRSLDERDWSATSKLRT